MENASKALLIAGGVLIAMFVASLGVYFARTISEQSARIAKEMEDDKITEFNQQFMQYDTNGAVELYIQDVVSIANLAKNSNKKNGLTDADAPIDSKNDTSLYVTVNMTGSTEISNIEKLTVEDLNEQLLEEEAEKKTELKPTLYKCSVSINQHTGYVNLIEISS